MMRRAVAVAAAGFVALATALACGDVPTLPGGVAYITPVQLPSPSIAAGDTMRDSLGVAAPLRVVAVGRDTTVTITDVLVRFILTSLRTGATIDERGYLVAPDSLQTLRLVAQVTDGTPGSALKLQTPEVAIDVVPLADSIAPSGGVVDTAQALPIAPRTLAVTVTGVGPGGTRGPVGGIRVRYRISQVFPASVATAGRYYLVEGSTVLRPDSTIAIDTTSAGGVASRTFVGIRAADGGADADSVLVTATAQSQRGAPLRGSPARFVIRFRKS